MFAKVQQNELTEQIRRQQRVITDQFRKRLGGEKYYHLALIPEKWEMKNTTEYQVINWEFFIDNNDLNVQDNFFYNYLRFALENYDELVSISAGGGLASEGDMSLTWWALCEGRMGTAQYEERSKGLTSPRSFLVVFGSVGLPNMTI